MCLQNILSYPALMFIKSKILYRKTLKMYSNFTFCFSFWGTSSRRPPTGPLPWTPLGDSPPQTAWPGPHHMNSLQCKILGASMTTVRVLVM